MCSHGRTVSLVLALLITCGAATARAEDAPPTADSAQEARHQYQLGTQAFKDKRYAEAAQHFEAAAAFRVSAVALYTAGLAWDLASKPERAADAYARALDVPGLDAKQTASAKERIAALDKTFGTLGVTAPQGWKVQLDQSTEVPTPARLHGAPGTHSLTVRAPGKPVDQREVMLEAGKVQPLELKDEPKPEPRAEEPSPETKPAASATGVEDFWKLRRVAGVGVAGLGVAALGATVILGTSAEGAADAYNASPTRAGFDHASSLETWTNVSLISGLVLLAGGVALVLLPDKTLESRVRVGLSGTAGSIGGTF